MVVRVLRVHVAAADMEQQGGDVAFLDAKEIVRGACKVVKSSREERNVRKSNIGDSDNTGDGGEIVGGAIRAHGSGIVTRRTCLDGKSKVVIVKVVKSSREERNVRKSNIGDSDNTGDGGKIVGGAIGARGSGIVVRRTCLDGKSKVVIVKVVKSSLEERNVRKSNIGDSDNTGDRGKIVGGVIGARGSGIVARRTCLDGKSKVVIVKVLPLFSITMALGEITLVSKLWVLISVKSRGAKVHVVVADMEQQRGDAAFLEAKEIVRGAFKHRAGEQPKSFATVVKDNAKHSHAKVNFRTMVNPDKVADSDFVLPMVAIQAVQNRFANSLVGFFVGKCVAFQLVKNYVTNTWVKFGFQKIMRDEDDFYYFKFASQTGLEQVLEHRPWLIRNTPIILNKWTPNLALSKDEVTRVSVWVKLQKVLVVTYLEDGLGLIGTCFVVGIRHRMRTLLFWMPYYCGLDSGYSPSYGNAPFERRVLWADLGLHIQVVRGFPWIPMGDFNVALNMEDILRVYQLDEVQRALDLNPDNSTLREEEDVHIQAFNETKLDEERFLKQKAYLENIEVVVPHVRNVFVTHYEQFLDSSMGCSELNVEGLFLKQVSTETSASMVRNITNEEIKAAMFGIGDDKASAPMVTLLPSLKRGGMLLGIKEVVSENQSTFIPGRRISDNILITQELMHNYHRNRGPLRCAFKIDIQKAYDTVDWHFLETILLRFSFLDDFRYHKHCDELEIINVCFADDLFIFARGDLESTHVIMDSLDEFKSASSLVSSIPKSTTYFCNVLNHVKHAILNIMPFSKEELPVKYLGVPLISSWLLNKDCKVLVEKAKNRIGDWKNKSLSFAGCLGLRTLDVFNIALVTTHIWNIVSNKESLWAWPQLWLLKASDIGQIPTPQLVNNMVDSWQWLDSNGVFSLFSVAWAWEALRSRGTHVDCTSFRPRYGVMCVSLLVWILFLSFCMILYYTYIPWEKSTARSMFGKLLLAATSYFIWLERNNRVFKKVKRSPEDIRDIIMVTVRLKLITFRFKNTTMVNKLLSKWKMPNLWVIVLVRVIMQQIEEPVIVLEVSLGRFYIVLYLSIIGCTLIVRLSRLWYVTILLVEVQAMA
uniref:DUF4283 domain-containing protein n=1 Tax=Tanacetum cinerariifolium TaxID=118510 RepID=A0A6L2JUM6_TANCI|nr:hypothetical protein [Tanacetum cinerariifolium]